VFTETPWNEIEAKLPFLAPGDLKELGPCVGVLLV
jgi:hypothetical protein